MAQIRSWAGLDVHSAKVIAAVMDRESSELRMRRLPGATSDIVAFCAGLPGPGTSTTSCSTPPSTPTTTPLAGGNAIIRADDRMLVHLALPWSDASDYPVLHLQRRRPDGLLDRYIRLLDQSLNHSSAELASDPDRYPHPDQDPDRYLPLAP